jgi:hypothetical protein
MKYLKTTVLLASVFAINIASAVALTPEEILAAIDGESDAPRTQIEQQKTSFNAHSNYTSNISQFAEDVLSAIDGESEPENVSERPRVNFDFSNNSHLFLGTVDTTLPRTYD